MRRFLFIVLSVVCTPLVLIADEGGTSDKPLRVLLVTGGCCHDYDFQTKQLKAAAKERDILVDWTVRGLLPGDPPRTWSLELTADQAAEAKDGYALRIANPLPNGVPLRFANEYSRDLPNGWWLLP